MDIYFLLEIVQWILLIYLGLSAFYVLLFGTASLFYPPPRNIKSDEKKKFLVLIPAYKEDVVILHVAEDALKQDYPSDKYDVLIIADSLKKETIKKLKNIPVNVLEVSFDQSTKAKSINKALEQYNDEYEGVVILDADNIMEATFLNKINDEMKYGFKAVQGHRIAKNQNSSLAILDGVSEEINNSVFRKGHVVLKLSSALIGSGMAFDFHLYKKVMAEIDSFAEDKELEFRLFQHNVKISFLNDAYVYDEKVSKADAFVDQRSRWIAYQLIYAKRFFFPAVWAFISKANFDYLDKVLQQLLPPRIMLIGLVYVISILSTIFNTGVLWYAWLINFFVVTLGILLSIPRDLYNINTLKAAIKLPMGFFLMCLSLLRIRKATKSFNPTPHTETTTDKSLRK